jgi:hypothetical protein
MQFVNAIKTQFSKLQVFYMRFWNYIFKVRINCNEDMYTDCWSFSGEKSIQSLDLVSTKKRENYIISRMQGLMRYAWDDLYSGWSGSSPSKAANCLNLLAKIHSGMFALIFIHVSAISSVVSFPTELKLHGIQNFKVLDVNLQLRLKLQRWWLWTYFLLQNFTNNNTQIGIM